jgi:invasion protein IalB
LRKLATLAVLAMLPSVTVVGQEVQAPVAKPPVIQDAGSAASAIPPGGWEPRCTSAGRTAPATCTLEQRLVVQETGQAFLTLTVRVPAEPRRPFLAVQMPLGLHLPSGLTLKVDAGKPLMLAIERCDQNGCYAGQPVADELLAAMKAGQTLNVAMRAGDGQELSLEVPLAGFARGYAAIQ